MKYTIGLAITGSFCTHEKILKVIENLISKDYDVVPIFSYSVASMNTRFGTAESFREKIISLTGHEPIDTIVLAEPIGPKNMFDALAVAPCTGNTLAKIACAITDTPVTMATKAHLRNNKPLVIAISTNDALGMNMKNIGALINVKNIYFVPFSQDDYGKKPNSLIANYDLLEDTILSAIGGKQIQPLLIKE